MNILRHILFLILLLFSSISFGQEPPEKVESISFAYGAIAGRSTVLTSAENNVKSGKFGKIKKLINSKSVSEQLIGAIVCLHLEEKQKITLTEKQKRKIVEIQQSEELLSFNFGCTCRRIIPLKDYFDGMNPCSFRDSANKWLEKLITTDQ